MPELPSEAGQSGGTVRLEWIRFAGRAFRETGRLRWEFQSCSDPSIYHTCDAEEGRCSCWGFAKYGSCIHFSVIAQYLKKLRNEKRL